MAASTSCWATKGVEGVTPLLVAVHLTAQDEGPVPVHDDDDHWAVSPFHRHSLGLTTVLIVDLAAQVHAAVVGIACRRWFWQRRAATLSALAQYPLGLH